ncbi:MAG: 23S rRNA (guanosine(2251)-2'-O)-methyltransferase RlmB, partial [Clostridia bacterium]|nr:23S rRNA (guanosine(2251)-2'-O)-methyltransferase RlmB [Clostridia bacterium]
MRQSYRDKQNRKARINREKEQKHIEKKNKQGYNKIDYKKENRQKEVEEKDYEDVVAGRNAVLELLKSDRDINKLYIERGEKHGSINEIIAKAKEQKVVVVEVSKQKLDTMAE